ncbi:MAG: aryl-sulfate sulfotransferase [Candidatus Eisenbacteria bacterium]|uniref:Aryl-sulfate sulfotransferase n=1 Tax=Eiseniibacteriota bacterium TaxID=2212470 RepID=A0A948S0P5_UNCEI|nr:aryl-sulfate sulfotransferase [Candidatus Eisenbacteria bacterium]MBU1947572.1 aryl-sulfate sulfotransferase [Candidatus Eisenbacteria bacterium]MBU2692697.1 aryl-sulfate sulfotransferase [Candidatus Eisenbacteria bacterium]
MNRTRPLQYICFNILFIIPIILFACSDENSTITDPGEGDDPANGWISWDHPDGTTHHYLPVSAPAGISWDAALDSANVLGGYLATITSETENEFIFDLIDSSEYWLMRPNGVLAGPWIGAYQPEGSVEPLGSWFWITGEEFSFTNWTADQPDERNNSNQDRIHYGESQGTMIPTWNDLGRVQALSGFVVEASSLTAPRTIGLFINGEGTYPGYTLFAPLQYGATYLIDMEGNLVHSWPSEYVPGNSAYLLENGHLLRTAAFDPSGVPPFMGGGAGGRVEEIDWNGSIVWYFEYVSDTHLSHHDIEFLPDGNLLMLAWEYKNAIEAYAAGRRLGTLSEGTLWPDHIIEIHPGESSGGSIVWEWHVWDHLIQEEYPEKSNYGVVAEHLELIDINYDQDGFGRADWNHTNGIDYNETFDQIIVSVRQFSEFWIIDHSTTTEEAAGHSGGNSGKGGDLLYRWGNPAAYGAGDRNDQRLFVQHDAQWIAEGLPGEGNVLVFNNGDGRPGGDYSSVDEIIVPVDAMGQYTLTGQTYGPSGPHWSYMAGNPADFYSSFISGAQRLPNGNTLICQGAHGTFYEVTASSVMLWKYVNPVADSGPLQQGDLIPSTAIANLNAVFRTYRYDSNFPGLRGRDLTPGAPIESYR